MVDLIKTEIPAGTIGLPPGWQDITDDAGGEDAPFTLARGDGVGALQFSFAQYRAGEKPNATLEALGELLGDFARSKGLGQGFDAVQERAGDLLVAARSHHQGNDFIRAWYVSDGSNFALVTYVCPWGEQQSELLECERMVRTLQLANAGEA